jgi:hypothetical protein
MSMNFEEDWKVGILISNGAIQFPVDGKQI